MISQRWNRTRPTSTSKGRKKKIRFYFAEQSSQNICPQFLQWCWIETTQHCGSSEVRERKRITLRMNKLNSVLHFVQLGASASLTQFFFTTPPAKQKAQMILTKPNVTKQVLNVLFVIVSPEIRVRREKREKVYQRPCSMMLRNSDAKCDLCCYRTSPYFAEVRHSRPALGLRFFRDSLLSGWFGTKA